MQGWIKLHRKILDHWCASEPEALAVWCRLMLEANHKTNKKMFNGKLIEIKRGQLIFGLNAFSAKSGVSVSKIRRYLKLFETERMIDKQITSKFSIITITCFDDYQGDDKQNTSKTQANDKQTTTPKECKNDKEVIDQFNFEDIRAVWNEVCSNSSTICQTKKIVDSKTKKQLPVIYKNYLARCKSAGKSPVDKPTWCKSYFEIVHEWAAGWQNFKDGDVFKLHLEYATRLATYEKVIEWNEHND